MIDIYKLNKLELKSLLKKITLLNSLKKSLGNRGIKEFHRINNGVNSYKIEYYNFGDTSLSYIKEKSTESFKKLFGLDIKIEEIKFIQNQNLKGGFRIYFNYNMYDLSYNRFEKLLKIKTF